MTPLPLRCSLGFNKCGGVICQANMTRGRDCGGDVKLVSFITGPPVGIMPDPCKPALDKGARPH
jgi:hypothetical protein